MPVEPQGVGERPKEALEVGARGEGVVLLLLQAADGLRPALGLGLDLVVAELAAGAGLAEGVSDLEHAAMPADRAGPAYRSPDRREPGSAAAAVAIPQHTWQPGAEAEQQDRVQRDGELGG